jgi:hypothetical protein
MQVSPILLQPDRPVAPPLSHPKDKERHDESAPGLLGHISSAWGLGSVLNTSHQNIPKSKG